MAKNRDNRFVQTSRPPRLPILGASHASLRGLERQAMPEVFRFGGVAKRRKDTLALVPVGKLIAIVAATGLSGLPCRNQQNGFVPIGRVGNKTHSRPMIVCRRTHAVDRKSTRLNS